LSAIAQAAKRSWGYPESWLDAWRKELTLAPEFIVTHAVYVAVEGDEIVGFYALGEGGKELEHLWIRSDRMRTGVGSLLFRHACRTARRKGTRQLMIVSDPHAAGFYTGQGARRVGGVRADMEGHPRVLPRLLLDLDEPV
jgi:GNAT superfamily N-acetyltransferase